MKTAIGLIGLVFVGWGCLACSGSSSEPDSGLRDADGDADGDSGTDSDPGQSFAVVVTAGSDLCTSFVEDRSWTQELALQARIQLKPGRIVLPRRAGSYAGDLIERIEFGPERVEPTPTGPGQFEAAYEDWGQPSWTYAYRRRYTLDRETYRVVVNLRISAERGVWPTEVTLAPPDDVFDPGAAVLSGDALIGPGDDWLTERQPFDWCEKKQRRGVYTADAASGTRLELDVRQCAHGYYVGETACYALQSAEVKLEGHTATVEEFFHLVYAARHHNWGEHYLVILDAKVGDVGAVLVQAPDPYGPVPRDGKLHYLNENLQTLRSEAITWGSAR